MNLSVCIIAKNEEKNIVHCLECLKSYGFEIVVIDTGSTDSTREIACRYTDNVYDFVWCDDFSAARNFSISKASNEYVMVLDCDEYLESMDIEKLFQMLMQYPDKVGRIQIRNVISGNKQKEESVEWLSRIFSKKHFYYEGRIHEQVTGLKDKRYETYQAPVEVLHSGYDLNEEEKERKAERNIKLLKQELERLEKEVLYDFAQEQIPYLLFQLGKSYYMRKDYAQACEVFSKGLSYDLNPRLDYVIDMVETYGYALLNSGQAEFALGLENIYEEFGKSADFQFLMGLIYMNNARFADAVREFEKAVEHKECRCKGVNSYSAYYNIGVIYECLGYVEQAQVYYKKCGEYEPALCRLGILKM